MGDDRGRRRTIEHDRGRWGTTQCRPSWVLCSNLSGKFTKRRDGRTAPLRALVEVLDDSTALGWAARYGHLGVVKVLIERGDVNPNHKLPDSDWGPLFWAAKEGHENLVKILLERQDVSPSTITIDDGRTPLSGAAENGHEGVVWMLLERAASIPTL